jgi:preprotein translocase subunit SecF
MQYAMGCEYNKADVEAILTGLNVGDFNIAEQGGYEINIRISTLNEDDVQSVQADLEAQLFAKYPNAVRSGDTNYVGPVAGKTLLLSVIVSMFTAVIVTRFLMRSFVNVGANKPGLFMAVKAQKEVQE